VREHEAMGVAPFDGEHTDHLPPPEWMVGDEEVAVAERDPGECELCCEAQLHDLWIVLGLGEE
jgi:hypothetical protein